MPILQDLQHLLDGWSLGRVRYQYNANQIAELVADAWILYLFLLWHEILCVQDAYLLGVLERMEAERQSEGDATEHPHVDLRVHAIAQVPVYHLGWSIHHRRESLVLLDLLVELSRSHAAWVRDVLAGRPKITEPERLRILIEEHILNFNISMLHLLRVHVLQAGADVFHDV